MVNNHTNRVFYLFSVVYFLISTLVMPSYILSFFPPYDMTPACHQILVQCVFYLPKSLFLKEINNPLI